MLEKCTLRALNYVPEGVPVAIADDVAHYDGFPTILDADIPMKVIGHFLRTQCGSPETAAAYRDDVFEFLYGLALQGRSWNDPALTDADFRAYRNLLCRMHAKNGRRRQASTIRRRLAGLKSFYEFARKAGYFEKQLDWQSICELPRDILKAESESCSVALEGGGVNYIPDDHLSRILWILGPSTSSEHNPADDNRPMRNRLAAETSFETNLRIDEVTHLRLDHVPCLPEFDPERILDDGFYQHARRHRKFVITADWTKGLVSRRVLLPYDLAWWLNWYVHVERRKVLDRAYDRLGRDEYRRRGLHKQRWLFLNGLDAPDKYIGSRFTAAMLGRFFHEAVAAAGYYQEESRAGGSVVRVTLYSFHDLRHTFAVLHYLARLNALTRKRVHDPERRAIEYVQTLLGHKSLETTRNHYVDLGRLLEAQLSDTVDSILSTRLRGYR